jgi:hypothetical protein
MAYPTTLAFKVSSPILGLQPIASTSTTQNHPLGTIVRAVDPTYGEGEFIYLTGVASTAAGDAVVYDTKTNLTARAVHTTAARGGFAVAMSANVASQYGWYQISGAAVVKAGTVAAAALLYLTSTAGTVDDAVVSTDKVDGALITAADGTPTAGYCTVNLVRATCNGNG